MLGGLEPAAVGGRRRGKGNHRTAVYTEGIRVSQITKEMAGIKGNGVAYVSELQRHPARSSAPEHPAVSNLRWLIFFHWAGGDAVGAVEEVGVVGGAASHEQQVLLRAFQHRNGGVRVVLQCLQFWVMQPFAVLVLG